MIPKTTFMDSGNFKTLDIDLLINHIMFVCEEVQFAYELPFYKTYLFLKSICWDKVIAVFLHSLFI